MSRQTAVWKSFIDRKNMEHADESVILHETVGMWKDKALRRKAVDARIQLKEEQALFSALFDWRQCRSSASAAASRTLDLRSTKATIELCRAFHIWSGLAKLTAAISSASICCPPYSSLGWALAKLIACRIPEYALLMDIKGRAAVASATRRMMQSVSPAPARPITLKPNTASRLRNRDVTWIAHHSPPSHRSILQHGRPVSSLGLQPSAATVRCADRMTQTPPEHSQPKSSMPPLPCASSVCVALRRAPRRRRARAAQ
eukprot:3033560-Rhodomonas_salina.1